MDDIKSFFTGKEHCGALGMYNLLLGLPNAKSDFHLPPKALSHRLRVDEVSSETSSIKTGTTAYHVLLTSPYFKANRDRPFAMEEYELLTAQVSALTWRRYNGPIYLVTDKHGERYFYEKRVNNVYNGVLPILDALNYGIDPKKYWAAGKLQALIKLDAPCAIIDLDLILWKPLNFFGYELVVAHNEHINERVYPNFDFFIMSKKYIFPLEWDKKVEPLNTAFMYFAGNSFKKYYADESIRFMRYERETPDDGSRCMVFAEQRILGMCAAARGIKPKLLLDYDTLSERQDIITHIWSAKNILKTNKSIAERYVQLCREKICQLSC